MHGRGYLIAAAMLVVPAACDDDDVDELPEVEPPIEDSFEIELTTDQEVPGCAAAGATATGAAVVTLGPDDEITVSSLTFSELSGPAVAAHIHAGAPGVAGPIVFDLGTDLTGFGDRTFTADDYPDPVPVGAPADFGAFLADLERGDTYINVHTPACPDGEIRGQIE